MIFLINKENKKVIQVRNQEEAKNIVNKFKDQGLLFEIIGVENKQKFILLHPEYKDYQFIGNNNKYVNEEAYNKALEKLNNMKYTDYLKVKNEVLEEDATVNYVMEKLSIPLIIARCLVKDWREQQDESK